MAVASIKVFGSSNPTVQWQMPLQDEAVYRDVKHRCLSTHYVSRIHGCLFPTRTNNLRNFAEDFFFPSMYHYAYKVDFCARAVIENLVCFLADLISFPIRILTCIPRAIYNALQKEHLLLTYLKQHDAPKELTEADRVQVELKADFGDESQFEETLMGNRIQVIKRQSGGELTVHFANVPEALISKGHWTSFY